MKTSNKLLILIKSFGLGAIIVAAMGFSNLSSTTVKAQEFTTGADFVSTYVWRGTAFSGPSIQPYVEFSTGGFAVGAWGSQGYDGFQEMDLYLGYTFDFGLSLGLTDYYYPGSPYFSYSEDPANGEFGSHAFEINAGYSVEALSISANYIINEASGAGSAGGDLYFEAGYGITDATSVFVGAGNGWHTVEDFAGEEDDFGLVNVGITTGKEIKITDTFSIPLSGSVILNPYSEQLYILAGISF